MGSDRLRTLVESALSHLSAVAGADLSLDARGMVALELPEHVTCSLEAPDGAEVLFVHAPIAAMPRVDREAILVALLQRNAAGLSIPFAWIGLDREARQLLLCAAIPVDAFRPEALPDILIALSHEVLDQRRALAKPSSTAAEPFISSDVIIRG